jgi:hypothetical protein
MPFVETGAEGLVIHESVRHAVNTTLRSQDPSRHRALRRRAWSHLRQELAGSPRKLGWSAVADVLYLVDEPIVREAFFPSDLIVHSVERAKPADGPRLLEAVSKHFGDEAASALSAWWKYRPQAFNVVRDEGNRLLGFYVLEFSHAIPEQMRREDPLVERWLADVASRFAARPVLLNRMTLSLAEGEGPSPERACSFLDIKRSYLENLELAAIYCVSHSFRETALLAQLGFESRPDLGFASGGFESSHTSVLEFGHGVLDWLTRLIDAQDHEPTESPKSAFSLDRKTRELVVDGERRRLTRLEYGVLEHLLQNEGAVATRDELLAAVWGQAHTGSNVVDVVVRSLRKKLGPSASRLETVTGFGYKLG